MDPLTHIAAGVLGGQTLRKPLRRNRHVLVFCIIAAWLPDIDNLIGFFGSEFYLVYHRGITHSFIGGILLAPLFTGIFKLFVKSFSFKRGVVLAYLFISLHIFLDLITSYGTQIFFPLTNARFSVPAVFIIDPVYTLAMGYFLYRSFRSPKIRRTVAIIGMIWVFLYPAMNLGIRYSLQSYVEKKLRAEGMEFRQVDVSTDVLTPIFWKVIVDEGDMYHIGGLNLLKLHEPLSLTRFQKAHYAVFRKFGKAMSLFKTYAWFFDYPVMTTEKSENKTMITLSDLRFATTVPFIQNHMNDRGLPFAITAILDNRQKLIGYYYNGPRQSKETEYLE